MKYYQPELEEFHLGFECEIETPNGIKTGCFPDVLLLNSELDQYKEDYNKAAHSRIRVKYLDEQDIKDLGWELQGETPSPYTGKPLKTFKIIKQVGFNTGSDYYLETTDSDKIVITIFEYSSYGGGKDEMSFTIKNKSELKKLMKQLGIIQ